MLVRKGRGARESRNASTGKAAKKSWGESDESLVRQFQKLSGCWLPIEQKDIIGIILPKWLAVSSQNIFFVLKRSILKAACSVLSARLL